MELNQIELEVEMSVVKKRCELGTQPLNPDFHLYIVLTPFGLQD